MINIFQFGSDDKSLVYLNQLFGSMNGIIPNPEGTPGTQTISLLGTMFQTFNTVILAVAVLVVVYVTIIGVIATAHEGEFLGKKWGGVWAPIRIVLGIATLVPAGSGYSGIQMIMMWIIVQGIGAADTLWNTVLSYINTTGGVNSQITVQTGNVTSTMMQLFQSLTCDSTGRLKIKDNPGGLSKGGYYCGQNTCRANPFSPTVTSSHYDIGPNSGDCGTLNYCNQTTACNGASGSNNAPDSITCAVCKAQVTALKSVISTLSGIGTQFAQTDYSYRDFYYNSGTGAGPSKGANWDWIYNFCSQNGASGPTNCCNRSPSPLAQQSGFTCSGTIRFPGPDQGTPASAGNDAVSKLYWKYSLLPSLGNVNFIDVASDYYVSELTNAVTAAIAAQGQTGGGQSVLNSSQQHAFDTAQQTGWIFAGAFYYTMASLNASNQQQSMPTFSMTGTNPQQSGDMTNYRNNYTAASTLVSLLPTATDSQGGGSSVSLNIPQSTMSKVLPSVFFPLTLPIDGLIEAVGKSFSSGVSGDMNPLMAVANAGNGMLLAVQVAYPIILIAAFAVGTLMGLNGWALGFGLFDPALVGGIAFYFFFAPVVFALLAVIFTMGGILGVYVPLIPYIIFTFGAISWFILTIEVLVAAPLVAIGILSPNNQGHEILGKSEPALMMIFNVFLRPALMVFGLMAAMILATIIVSMINFAFWKVVKSVPLSSNVLSMFIFLFVYVAIIVAALNKCFRLIDHLPDRVLSWAGGKGERMEGAEHVLGEAKSHGAEHGMREARQSGESRVGEAKQLGTRGPEKEKGMDVKGKKGDGGGGATG